MKRKILTLLFVFCMLLTNVTFVSVSAATSPVVIIEHDDFEDLPGQVPNGTDSEQK